MRHAAMWHTCCTPLTLADMPPHTYIVQTEAQALPFLPQNPGSTFGGTRQTAWFHLSLSCRQLTRGIRGESYFYSKIVRHPLLFKALTMSFNLIKSLIFTEYKCNTSLDVKYFLFTLNNLTINHNPLTWILHTLGYLLFQFLLFFEYEIHFFIKFA